jgi:glycosyltransferase involved in cell wall biosynthesis
VRFSIFFAKIIILWRANRVVNSPFASVKPASPLPVFLAHHWLVSMRGGERVLEQLGLLFPSAPIYTLCARPDRLSGLLRGHPIRTSSLQSLPGIDRYYPNLLPLYPFAQRALQIPSECRLLLSNDACMIKGIPRPPEIPHVCYCLSPPRYLWDMQETYLQHATGISRLARFLLPPLTRPLQRYDNEAAARVDFFITLSTFAQERIRKIYGRDSVLIAPPVDVDAFHPNHPPGDFYLLTSELVAYKRVDLAIEAFNRLGKNLVIIGDGFERRTLEKKAGKTITFLGRQPFPILKDHYERCRAFIFPQIEDFGITAVEAQAAGRPVLAYRAGGALDTVIENETGLFFDEQSAEALADAVDRFEKTPSGFDPARCRANAEKYRPERFRREIRDFLTARYPDLFSSYSWPQ